MALEGALTLLLLAAAQAQQPAQLETEAAAAFASNRCPEAIQAYEAALPLVPEAAKAGLYYRRIGICKGRLEDLEGSLEAYRKGVEVSEGSADREVLEENLHGLGLALQRLGRLREAMAPAARESDLAAACGHPAHTVRSISLLASLYDRTGQVRRAIALREKGLALARAAQDENGILVMLDNLANSYAGAGDLELALKMQREIIALTPPDHEEDRARAHLNIAAMFQTKARYKEALANLDQVLELKSISGYLRASALLNMGETWLLAPDPAGALPWLNQAVEFSRTLERREILSEALWTRASTLAALGRPIEGRKDALEALESARQSSAPRWEYEAWIALGKVEDATRNREAARASYEAAVNIGEFLRVDLPAEPSQLRQSFERQLEAYQLLVRDLIALNEPAAALRTAERAKARVLMDILLGPGLSESTVMTPEERATEARLRSAAQTGKTDAIHALDRFRRGVYTAHPELVLQSGNFAPPEPEQLDALLPDVHTALVEYFRLPQGFAVFVVRKTGAAPSITARILDLSVAEVTRFREQIARRDLDYKPSARHLYDSLFAPVLPDLKDTGRWILSPDGALWELPFGALVDPRGHHLLETHVVSLVPSFAALAQIRARRRSAFSLDLLAIADVGLPAATAEVKAIAASWRGAQTEILTGPGVTEQAFREASPRARIVHLAVHGQLNNREPLYSALELGSGKITASDILQMRIPAELVVLSACDTALGSAAPGEGIIGMGWALTAAGARASVLSYWKIGSESASRFMIEFHRDWAKHPGAASLRTAALATLQDPATRHPFYWAAFSLWGDAP